MTILTNKLDTTIPNDILEPVLAALIMYSSLMVGESIFEEQLPELLINGLYIDITEGTIECFFTCFKNHRKSTKHNLQDRQKVIAGYNDVMKTLNEELNNTIVFFHGRSFTDKQIGYLRQVLQTKNNLGLSFADAAVIVDATIV